MDSLKLPKPPIPMTPAFLISYLQTQIKGNDALANEPVMIDLEQVVNAKVVDGRVVLQTFVDYLNDQPPCKTHKPVQHRDGKSPWCESCGLTIRWTEPTSMFR